MKQAARIFLLLVYAAALTAPWIAPSGYAEQFRDHSGEAPSLRFPLGVDDLGRDRLSRVIYGSRVSLLLAPAAALFAVTVAAGMGLAAGTAPPLMARGLTLGIDLLLSLPTLFLLLIARAMLPLNSGPWYSVLVTFLLLGALGWPAAARIIGSSTRASMRSTFLLQARATGCSPWRLLRAQLLPNLRGVITAQLFLLIPMFILAEANLGILGLGVSEPLPSWGTMLAELTNLSAIGQAPWRLVPAVLLLLVVLSFYLSGKQKEVLS